MTEIILSIRFLLEVVTVLGILSGLFIKKEIYIKILFLILSILITLIWARYGAPKSPHVLTGLNKLMLEIFVYSVGSISFYKIFGLKIGLLYIVIAMINLLFMYLFALQGK
ncbi:DUF2568 domain-containing protein [Enterococcus sp. DIV0170]|jgi:hypothetical protein|uniref:DUF2568 domain-containing protein n=1 Tax=Enterococcus sp. DIV0170 TaxID=2774642 RepID=UPI003F223B96